ncbi:hypothetical protein D3C85_1565640 [compost metagenome]
MATATAALTMMMLYRVQARLISRVVTWAESLPISFTTPITRPIMFKVSRTM